MCRGKLMSDCCCDSNKSTKRSAQDKKDLTSRVNRIIGQMNGISKMIEEDRYCGDIIIQLSAIDKSIKSLANVILDKHLHSCVEREVKEGHDEVLDEIVLMFKRFQ